jgi:hypothetical protein
MPRIWRNDIGLKRQKRNVPNAKKVSTTLRKDVRIAAPNTGMLMTLWKAMTDGSQYHFERRLAFHRLNTLGTMRRE